MKTFKNYLKEEVFYWYIIKGTTSKGKVWRTGTEREMKLLLRKPTTPSGHILMKSRKDLKIGAAWKGSMGVSEEVEIDEVLKPGAKVKVPHPAKGKGMVTGKIVRYDKGGPHSPFYVVDIGEPRSEKIPAHKIKEEVEIDEGSVLDIKDVDKWMKEIEKGIDAPWIQVRKSALGGDENVAIMIKLSLDAEKDWPHKILHNSRYAMISLGANGKLEMFSKGRGLKNMRKTNFKTAKDAISKINIWIKKVT